MRIAAHRGNKLHAPENSRLALIAGYTGGAGVLEFDLQLTKDGHLVLLHDGTIDRLTGVAGNITEMTLADLAKVDASRTFQPRHSPGFRFLPGNRRLKFERFPEILDALPEDVELLIELKPDAAAGGRREEFATKAVTALDRHGVTPRTVLYAKDAETLRVCRKLSPDLRLAAFDFEKTPDEQLALMLALGADGLVTDLDSVLAGGALTPFGQALQKEHAERRLRVGAAIYPFRKPGVFSEEEWRALKDLPFVWSLSTDSMFDVAFTRRAVPVVEAEAFAGKTVDVERFALGYAKANRYGHVFQDDGIHVDLREFGAFPPSPTDPLEKRLQHIEDKLTNTAKDWPYYSGGGLGYVPGVRGDFAAEVDYVVGRVAQATTLEMAVLNVDPGVHQPKPPQSFRDKDSFYDPHGAPPYVGVEHDEDDGYRINWNLGSEYDSNQYGRPIGMGRPPDGAATTAMTARLRLERRGPYFAAYYRNETDVRDWVCCGVARNDSLNPVVFLRCVGKRWRQENPDKPHEFLDVIPNTFVFKNLSITRYI
jgi:hypothetical protein